MMDYYLWRKIKERIMIFSAYAALFVAMIPLVSILSSVVFNGIRAVDFDFLTKLPTAVGEPGGGVANAILGTLIVVGFASLMGVPIGVFSGVYLSEFRDSKLSMVIRFFNDVLTEFPSIVIGIFAYTLIVLYTQSFSAFAGAFALAIIMIPIIARTTEEAIKLVPGSIREAGMALGLPRWKTALRIMLSTARGGILTGIMLSVARISGETAPLLLTAFNSFYWFAGLDKPIASLPLYIYIYSISPFEDWRTKAWGAALVLIMIVLLLNIGVRILARGKYRP